MVKRARRVRRGVGVKRRERPGVSGVERLQQIEGFPAANLTQEDAVRSQPERRLQKIANRDRRQTWLLAAGLEPNQIRFSDLDLGGVFDQDDALLVGDGGGESV